MRGRNKESEYNSINRKERGVKMKAINK